LVEEEKKENEDSENTEFEGAIIANNTLDTSWIGNNITVSDNMGFYGIWGATVATASVGGTITLDPGTYFIADTITMWNPDPTRKVPEELKESMKEILDLIFLNNPRVRIEEDKIRIQGTLGEYEISFYPEIIPTYKGIYLCIQPTTSYNQNRVILPKSFQDILNKKSIHIENEIGLVLSLVYFLLDDSKDFNVSYSIFSQVKRIDEQTKAEGIDCIIEIFGDEDPLVISFGAEKHILFPDGLIITRAYPYPHSFVSYKRKIDRTNRKITTAIQITINNLTLTKEVVKYETMADHSRIVINISPAELNLLRRIINARC